MTPTPLRAILLAGGRGTRLAPYTTVLPKPLMPIGDMPIAEILIRQLKRAGVREITFSVGYLSSLLRAYFEGGKKFDVKISYSEETQPLGTAGPLALVPNLESTFLVANGDILTTLDFKKMIQTHRKKKSTATVGIFSKKVTIDLGVLKLSRTGALEDYIEKPTFSYDVSIGCYVFEPEVLKSIPKNKKFDLPDLIKALMKRGETVDTFACEGIWLDIGRHDDYKEATALFEKKKRLFL